PALRPAGYVDRTVLLREEGTESAHIELRLDPCPARDERGRESWIMLLADGRGDPLSALVQAVDATTRVEPLTTEGETLRWRVTNGHEPAKEPSEVLLTRFSTGADFV